MSFVPRSAFTKSECDENDVAFMRQWAEVIAILGTQVVEAWTDFESKGAAAFEAFDPLIQANVLSAAHRSRVGQFKVHF